MYLRCKKKSRNFKNIGILTWLWDLGKLVEQRNVIKVIVVIKACLKFVIMNL